MEKQNEPNQARRIAARVAKASKKTARVAGNETRKIVYAIGVILTIPGTLIAYAARKREPKTTA